MRRCYYQGRKCQRINHIWTNPGLLASGRNHSLRDHLSLASHPGVCFFLGRNGSHGAAARSTRVDDSCNICSNFCCAAGEYNCHKAFPVLAFSGRLDSTALWFGGWRRAHSSGYVVLAGIFTADPRKLNWGILASLQVFNYSTLFGGPIGEEIGWTGYALPRLEERWGLCKESCYLACFGRCGTCRSS